VRYRYWDRRTGAFLEIRGHNSEQKGTIKGKHIWKAIPEITWRITENA
jgi:hypothetical protein